MSVEVDHVFICCTEGAPEADAFVRLGLTEGSANSHPGQGTACRRFFFESVYLELLWVSDPDEARGEAVARTRLWERWSSSRRSEACPFGVVLRPGPASAPPGPPFPTWAYRPRYLPPERAIDVAEDAALDEPAWFHLAFQRRGTFEGREPMDHALGVRRMTSVSIGTPLEGAPSPTWQAVQATGAIALCRTARPVLDVTFDHGAQQRSSDLRPTLPMVLRW